MEKLLIENYNKDVEKASKLVPKWKVGDKVRVLKSLRVNVMEVEDFLGQICTVAKINFSIPVFGDDPRVEYLLRLGKRVEPFCSYELDSRFKSK